MARPVKLKPISKYLRQRLSWASLIAIFMLTIVGCSQPVTRIRADPKIRNIESTCTLEQDRITVFLKIPVPKEGSVWDVKFSETTPDDLSVTSDGKFTLVRWTIGKDKVKWFQLNPYKIHLTCPGSTSDLKVHIMSSGERNFQVTIQGMLSFL